MHLTKSSKKTLALLTLFGSVNLFAEPIIYDDSILSDPRKKIIELSNEQIKEDSSKLKKDWINPITYQYKKNLGEEFNTDQSIISINQPIFQSGGIYKAIKYADSTYDYAKLEIDQQKKELIKNAVEILFNIKKTDLNIQKAQLTLQNAKIDVNRKKEQVLNGFLDASYLDNALLTLNTTKHTLVDLKYQKENLINNFNSISSKEYINFELPIFKMFSKEEFLKNNIEIKKAKADIEKKGNYSFMTMAKYLPSVNAYYNYSKYHDTDNQNIKENSETYGLTINVPLDSRTFNDIQSKKIDYLKSKLSLETTITDEKNFFKTNLQKLDMIEERIKITNEDIEVYDSILSIIKEEKEAELKTQSDLDTLQNSAKIKKFDKEIYQIDKQLTLLEMYVKLH
ncbi:TolC family protein [Malaciobacter pacificus]|nr:TolC family protein [Malaciobacter pacificus]